MKTHIILTLDQLTDQERCDLRYLLTDALAEFEATRRGNYVKKRYKDTFTGPRAEKRMEAKQEEVERRRALAKKLKHAAHEMQVIDVDCAGHAVEDPTDLITHLNQRDRETHPPTAEEVGDYPDYPDIRYDR